MTRIDLTLESTLPGLHGRELPPLAFAYRVAYDPRGFVPISKTGWVKPDGGLWTAPVTATAPNGDPTSTSWLDWCRGEDWNVESYPCLTEVIPRPDARVVRIDSVADLAAVVDNFPASLGFPGASRYPDWSALAASGWDAVYLTDKGQWATRMSHPLDLYGWDCASVLWLRPAFTVGRTVRAVSP